MKQRSKKLGAIAALGLAFAAAPVSAELNDSPYFNLFGGNTEITLCGTAACDGSATTKDYGIFSTVAKNSATGSGNIDPFLRFQHNEGLALGSADVESAFNTTNTNVGTIFNPDTGTYEANQAKDSVAGGQKRMTFNHAVKLSELLAADGDYATFLLDINETGGGGGSLLRIDELALFVGSTDQMNEYSRDIPGESGTDLATGKFIDPDAISAKVWDMDFNALPDGTVLGGGPNNNYGGLVLDNSDNIASGSGDWDMEMQIHKELFTDALGLLGGITADDAWVYLYNEMGEDDPAGGGKGKGGGGDEDLGEACCGFEEWGALTTVVDEPPGGGVPEPGTALLILGGMAGMYRLRRKRSS